MGPGNWESKVLGQERPFVYLGDLAMFPGTVRKVLQSRGAVYGYRNMEGNLYFDIPDEDYELLSRFIP
jgi:hypothetical protein